MKRESARKHATYAWTCPLCEKVCMGNGGQASHKAMHLRRAGVSDSDIALSLDDAWRRFREQR